MILHHLHLIEPGIAPRLADAEHKAQVGAVVLFLIGGGNVRRGAQRAGDVQIHQVVVAFAAHFLHAVQAVLKHRHLGHRVAAQLLAAGQPDDLGILGPHQLGQLRAVGIQRNIGLYVRVSLQKQLGGAQGIVHQRLAAEALEVFVAEALAARTARDTDEQFLHLTIPPVSALIRPAPWTAG